MIAARAAFWRSLPAWAALAAVPAHPRRPAPAPPHTTGGHGCAAAACALARPSAAEVAAIVADADRMLARHAGDTTALGRECRALGAAMRAGVGEVRMLAHAWRAPDPEGHLAPVTGDAHTVEPSAGAGRVHIARGFDALNPDRGLAAIAQTARHEFAHLAGARQGASWEVDLGDQLATACGGA